MRFLAMCAVCAVAAGSGAIAQPAITQSPPDAGLREISLCIGYYTLAAACTPDDEAERRAAAEEATDRLADAAMERGARLGMTQADLISLALGDQFAAGEMLEGSCENRAAFEEQYAAQCRRTLEEAGTIPEKPDGADEADAPSGSR